MSELCIFFSESKSLKSVVLTSLFDLNANILKKRVNALNHPCLVLYNFTLLLSSCSLLFIAIDNPPLYIISVCINLLISKIIIYHDR